MTIHRILQLLASLVALVGAAPAYLFLDLPVQVIGALALLIGFLADRNNWKLLPALPATLFSFLAFFVYLAQMSRASVVEPLINMLVVLLAVRLVTEKSGRNLLQIFVLSTFVLAASSLLSLSVWYLVSLVVLISLITFGLLLTSFFATAPSLSLAPGQWRSLLKTGALLPLGSLVLMLFFFTILPRTEYPLWHFLNPGPNPAAGFSEEVKPGSLANLGSSGVPAFRAEMQEIDPQELYWRGIVLNRIDGNSWKRSKNPPLDVLIRDSNDRLEQRILTEPRNDRYLPGLDLPGDMKDIRSQRQADHIFETRSRLKKRASYTVSTSRRNRLKIKNPLLAEYYLRTPERVSPRVHILADEIARQKTRDARIAATRDFFLQQQLSYAARNLDLSDTPVDSFLFETKRGYCEYFASSFALLLRLSDVPARLVGGYLGGRYNQWGGYYLVDEDMAHVWVEALDDNDQWRRVDPSRLAINAGNAVTGLNRRGFNWAQAAADYMETSWNRLIITYDLHKQLSLIFSTARSLRQIKPPLPGGFVWWFVSAAVVGILIRMAARRLKGRKTAQDRLVSRYLTRVGKTVLPCPPPPDIGLYEIAARSNNPLCAEFARIYGAALYTDRALTSEERHKLRQIIRKLA